MTASRTHIVAEIGTSHQGDLAKAIELIHAAKDAGADTAKFQWVYADEIIHPNTGFVKLPTGNIALYDRFKSMEQGPDFFASLKDACAKTGLGFLCTPFGLRSAKELLEIGVDSFKIASPELNHIPLLEFLGATGLQLIVSSGVSKLADIEEALETIRSARQGRVPNLETWAPEYARYAKKLVSGKTVRSLREDSHLEGINLLHCMTSYPAPEDEYNLLLIHSLAAVFLVPLGISDHSMDPVLVPVISTILGGRLIEKHFTLSNATDGLDDPIALAPIAFREMVVAVRRIEGLLAQEAAKITNFGAASVEAATGFVTSLLRGAGIEVQDAYVAKILGNGRKFLAEAERTNYGRTNRSIHALTDLKAGRTLRPEDLCVIRTEKVLRPGLHPRHLVDIIGKTLRSSVSSGQGLLWSDFLK